VTSWAERRKNRDAWQANVGGPRQPACNGSDLELADLRSELLKWMFLFWVTTLGAFIAVIAAERHELPWR
jgi:hypothetical protein